MKENDKTEYHIHCNEHKDAGSTLIGAMVEKIHLPKDFVYKMENHKLYLFYYIKHVYDILEKIHKLN